jgi:hypothetical protein
MLKDISEFALPALRDIAENPNFRKLSKGFTYPTGMPPHAILFIGVNQFHADEITSWPIQGYRFKQQGNEHPYFHPFEEISDFCQTPWSYMDILFDRASRRKRIQLLMESTNGQQFIGAQLAIADRMIRETTPEVIVVCSTMARMLVGIKDHLNENRWLGSPLIFDNNIGTYRWEDIPVFFSTPLSGTKALDTESYQRLKWHIRTALRMEIERELESVKEEKNRVVKHTKYEEAADLRELERLLEKRVTLLRF